MNFISDSRERAVRTLLHEAGPHARIGLSLVGGLKDVNSREAHMVKLVITCVEMLHEDRLPSELSGLMADMVTEREWVRGIERMGGTPPKETDPWP